MNIKKAMLTLAALLLIVLIALLVCLMLTHQKADTPHTTTFEYSSVISANEQANRNRFVETALTYLGYNEADGTYKEIIDVYNAHKPLAMNYEVRYTDEWCAAFVSAVAIRCNMTQIIPTECGCERQIQLFRSLGSWEENDTYIPMPGDIIYYHTDHCGAGDCTDWSDHVGIVVGVHDGKIKVIEGNYSGSVRCRTLPLDSESIRGFAVPQYNTIIN